MELAISIVAAVTGIAGIIISIVAMNHNKIEAINAFFINERDPIFIESRRIVHQLREDGYNPQQILEDKELGDKVAYLISTYQQASVLIQKRQLPFWIFNGKTQAASYALVSFYKTLEPYIKMRRERNNPAYAKQYEYLYKRVKKSLNEITDN